jgi:RNA polymerase sigma-70 factor (ECF subfamily)
MTAEELNWLLQTIKDAANAERFVLAQFRRGRISLQLMADLALKRGWISRSANQFAITTTRYFSFQMLLPERSGRMFEQITTLQKTGSAQRAIAREEDRFLVAAKRGDSAAFEILCRQSANTVFRIARQMMRSKEDAEDVLQESFLLAYIHLKSFKGGSRFSTWLSRIAINASLMKLRRKQHLRDVSLDESVETVQTSSRLDLQDQGPNPEQLYAQKERERILSEAMNDLTPGMRKAIELRELGERSTEETAEIMGISVNAVKARVFHGRKKLRERLKDHFGSAWTTERDTSRMIGNTRDSSQGQIPCNARA